MNKEANINVALSEIRRQLWSGHASVMVGSGFSRNADRASSTIPYPPDWNILARKFINRLYPAATDEEKAVIQGRKSVLQLAQEFEAAFQRASLNRYIKELICDENLIPNSLFYRLLELPWNDVFTTNYDTLLERAARSVLTQKYDVVYSCKDLAFSDSPRIIKLHGSFPTDATPLIVTEEDYRTYPIRCSPFVNTVQQTLMENILCLIGFSGTDPNFLKWIGWVRDNLGDAMPSIYLIGFMRLTDAERRVLETKRIIPVDLSELMSLNSNGYADALDAAFTFLEERPSFVEWAPVDIWGLEKLSQEEAIEKINQMAQNRGAYPNWIVIPWNKKERMFSSTERATLDLSYIETLPSPWDIKCLYELNWRMERCLLPISNTTIKTYQHILDKYKPSDAGAWRDVGLRQIWREIAFAVYRWCREEQQTQLRQQLETDLTVISPDDIESVNRLCYERVLWSFTFPDAQRLKEALQQWDKVTRSPLWDVRYAAILCEVGRVAEGVQIYENVLSTIRPNIPKGKIKSDYFLLCLEGIVLTALSFAHDSENIRKQDKLRSGFGLEYHHRLEELAALECDPNVQMSRFRTLMSSPELRNNGLFKNREFDLVTQTWKASYGWPEDNKRAYQFARFIEEISIPLHVGNVTSELTSAAPGCIRRLAKCSPSWAFGLYNRIGRTNEISEEVFISQRTVYYLANDQIDEMIERYSFQIRYLIENHQDQLIGVAPTIYSRMAAVMFEVLSRLSAKASQNSLITLLSLGHYIEKMAVQDYDILFKDFHIFYYRVIGALQPQTLFENFELLLAVGIPPSKKYWRWWQSPLALVSWKGYRRNPDECTAGSVELINQFIRMLLDDEVFVRTAALLALNKCIELGVCNSKQRRQIAQNLNTHVGTDGLPKVSRFFKHVFLSLLEPIVSRETIGSNIKKAFLTFDYVAIIEQDVQNNRCNGAPRIENFANSILATSSVVHSLAENRINMTRQEVVVMLRNFKEGIEKSIDRVRGAPSIEWNFSADLKSRLSGEMFYYDRILGEVIIPQLTKQERVSVIKWLRRLDFAYPFLCSRIMLELMTHKMSKTIEQEIMSAISGENIYAMNDGVRALRNWCEMLGGGLKWQHPSDICYQCLVDIVAMKDGESFSRACETIGAIVHFVPLPKYIESQLLLLLGILVEATAYDSEYNRFENEDRGDYRAATAYMASQLYDFYSSRNEKVPEPILKWQKICTSPNELWSVRKYWSGAQKVQGC